MSFNPSSSVSGENNLSYLNQEDQVKPIVVRARRAPTTADRRFKIGTLWVNQDSNISYQLTSVSAGLANWGVLSAGSGDLDALTGDSGGAIGPDGGGNINIVGNDLYTVDGTGNTLTITETTGAYPITPFVVGPVGQAGYQTIQAAMDAANAAGEGLVAVQPGTYNENLTFYDGICLAGALEISGVVLIGTHTPPASGTLIVRNLVLQSVADVFSSAVAGTTTITLIELATAVNGFTFNLPNWTGPLNTIQYFETFSINGFSNNTGGSDLILRDSNIGNGNSNTLICTGSCSMINCLIGCPVDFQTGASVVANGTAFSNPVTFSNDSVGILSQCTFLTDPDAAITFNSTGSVGLIGGGIETSNDPAIDGAGVGTITLTGVDFQSNSNLAGTLNIATGTTRSGNFIATSIGDGIEIAEGANAKMGTATLTAGTVTVSNTSVTATSRIFLTSQVDGGFPGWLRITATTVGTDFTITSDNIGDTSTVAWLIMEPA